MIHLVATKHLVYSPSCQLIFARDSATQSGPFKDHELCFTCKLGDIWDGSDFPIPAEIQSEWIDLIEWEAMNSQARR